MRAHRGLEQGLIVTRQALHCGRLEQVERVFGDRGAVQLGIDGDGQVELWRSGITLEDCRQVTVRGLILRQSPASSVVMGAGCRDCVIDACTFAACGVIEGGVTLWLGTGTSGCTVSGCAFDMLGAMGRRHLKRDQHCYDIAIMCAQDDCTGHRFLGNRIVQYSYGIQLGVRGDCREPGRHEVRGNRIEHPWADGIHLKQGDNLVEENVIIGATRVAMSSRAGMRNRFRSNTVLDGYLGLRLRGPDHEVVGNRFERCRRAAISLEAAKPGGDGFAAENVLVTDNDCIDCGGADAVAGEATPECAGIVQLSPLPQRLGANRIVGAGAALCTMMPGIDVQLSNGRGLVHPVHRG